MLVYISIDGDDIGNKIAAACYDNDETILSNTIIDLNTMLANASIYLKSLGYVLIFFAADGIVCKGEATRVGQVSKYIKQMGRQQFTFSAGVGKDLRSSFIALRYAKSTGKSKIISYDDHSNFTEV